MEHINKGIISILSSEDRQRILSMGQEVGNQGLRVLGLAIKAIEKVCLILLLGKLFRPEFEYCTFITPLLLSYFRVAEKGVKAEVLTSDSLHLAIRVCKQVGITSTHVITGPDLEQEDGAIFHETIKNVTVLSRPTPAQKPHVVQSLQMAGEHLVCFLGDGINDSLALDAADVGISVDSGASAAKDVADIILLEKDLNVLVAGVERGRIIYGNIMKYIRMSVVAKIGSTVSLLVASFCLPFEPLTSRQLLTQNFLYNLGQIAIPWDNLEEVYTKTPRR